MEKQQIVKNLTSQNKLYNTAKFGIFIFLILILGCESKDEEGLDDTTGQIYFRIVEDLNYPNVGGTDWCDESIGNYVDDNPGIPSNAILDNYYGPLQAGNYQATFNLLGSSNLGPCQFSYQLQYPASGFKRMYTKILKRYSPSLNRCINVSAEPGTLTYVDEEL